MNSNSIAQQGETRIGAKASVHSAAEAMRRQSPSSRRLSRLVLSHPAFLVLIDLAIGIVAYLWAWFVRSNVSLPFTQDLLTDEQWQVIWHPWIALAASQAFLLYIFGLYDELRKTRYREIAAFVMSACVTQALAIASVYFFAGEVFPRTVIPVFVGFNFVMLCGWRVYVKSQLKRHNVRVLIVSERRGSASEIIEDIEKSPWMGMEIAGLALSEDDREKQPSAYPILGSTGEIAEIIASNDIDEIVVASEPTWKDRMLNSISRLQEASSVRIAIMPSVYEMVIGKLEHVNIHDTPLISVRRNPNEPFQRFVKRSFDILVSALGLIILAPLLAVVGLLVRLTSSGPAFYRQDRVGRGGRIFRLIKFRTMSKDAEAHGRETLAQANDPRVTSIGRFLRRTRLDELPQLINVLKGDMSFVGPRPERPGFVAEFQRSVTGYSERHKIKPGITGLAQVRGYYHTSAEGKLKYDLAYIYNYSFSLDLFLLIETLKVVLTRQGS